MTKRMTVFYDQEEEEQIIDEEKEKTITLKEIVSSKMFWVLYVMFTLSSCFGSFFQASAKTYASNIIQDDTYLSLVATIASFCRILCFVWSIVMERFNFRFAYFMLLAI